MCRGVFNPLTSLTPTETVLPSQLPYNSIDYTWVEDMREGYEGLAVVNITWQRQEGHEYITSYNLTLFLQSVECGGHRRQMKFYNIPKVNAVGFGNVLHGAYYITQSVHL